MTIDVGVVDAARTRELRRSVLRPHLTPADPLPGDDIANAVHLAATDDTGTVLCTCFIRPERCPWQPDRVAWRLRAMATLPQRRGEGLGAGVVTAAAEHAHAAGAQLLWCHAREGAIGFYRRLGFASHGALFTPPDVDVPHLAMWRELGAGPASSR